MTSWASVSWTTFLAKQSPSFNFVVKEIQPDTRHTIGISYLTNHDEWFTIWT